MDLVATKAAAKTKLIISNDPSCHPGLLGVKTTTKMFSGNSLGSSTGFHGSITPDSASIGHGGSTVCGHASAGWTDPSGTVDIHGGVHGCVTHPPSGGFSGNIDGASVGISVGF